MSSSIVDVNMSRSVKRVAILFANYGPYHIARVRAAYKALENQRLSVIGIEISRGQKEYLWQTSTANLPFELFTLFPECLYEEVRPLRLLPKLISLLSRLNPDIVAIAGYSEPAMIIALAWAKLHCKAAVLLSESKEDDAERNIIKEKIKRWIVNNYDSAMVGGKPQKRYLEKLSFPSAAIWTGYNVVDNEVFSSIAKSETSPLERKFFLAINRFVPKKNLILLLRAYARYRYRVKDSAWDLVLCGDGDLRQEIEIEMGKLHLNSCVHLPGFLQQNELLPYFSHASCFIHASLQEQWGLVVNEAMAAGIPPLVSRECGCFEDLILENITGFGFDPTNLDELSQKMTNITKGEYELSAIGRSALKHINQHFSPDQFGAGLSKAVQYSLSG